MMLEVKDLAAAYSGIEALRGVSLHIEAGEMVALIGANGAGKSTLLNCLSGTVRPRGGSIRFEGKEIAGTKPHRVARLGLLHSDDRVLHFDADLIFKLLQADLLLP